MENKPQFAWQYSRTEFLYVDQETKRICGFIAWKDDNRLNIEASAVIDKRLRQFASLGRFAGENQAKQAVEEQVAAVLAQPDMPVAKIAK